MRAITVAPGQKDSARLDEIDEPRPGDGDLLVQMLSLGVCGTDAEIVSGGYGWPPEGEERLVLGHESLGRVVEAPSGSDFSEGDLVAGPIGLLAGLLGTQGGLQVHVLDRVPDGPKPELVRDIGATYHSGSVEDACGKAGADILVECTGVGELVVDAMTHTASGAIVCLTGVSACGYSMNVDIGSLNNELVLQNDVVFGSVNANRRHFHAAAEALAAADRGWLERLITPRAPLE